MISGLPERIRELRKKFNYSQKQVADKIGVSPSIISGYENGERTPSVDILLALSYLFNCSTDYLLGKNVPVNSIIVNTNGMTEEQIIALNNFIYSMTPKKAPREKTV